jgi:hypothetical protein
MKPKHVRLFIKPGCPWCDEAIEWLDARKIQYETLDVIRLTAQYTAVSGRGFLAGLAAREGTAPARPRRFPTDRPGEPPPRARQGPRRGPRRGPRQGPRRGPRRGPK